LRCCINLPQRKVCNQQELHPCPQSHHQVPEDPHGIHLYHHRISSLPQSEVGPCSNKITHNQIKQSNITIQGYSENDDVILPGAITGWATEWSSGGLGLLLKSGGHDFWGKVEICSEELNSIVGEEPVIMHPSKCLAHVLPGLEALHQLYHLQIWNINLRVLRQIVVLLRKANSLWFKTNHVTILTRHKP